MTLPRARRDRHRRQREGLALLAVLRGLRHLEAHGIAAPEDVIALDVCESPREARARPKRGQVNLDVRLPAAIVERVDALAAAHARTKEAVIVLAANHGFDELRRNPVGAWLDESLQAVGITMDDDMLRLAQSIAE